MLPGAGKIMEIYAKQGFHIITVNGKGHLLEPPSLYNVKGCMIHFEGNQSV